MLCCPSLTSGSIAPPPPAHADRLPDRSRSEGVLIFGTDSSLTGAVRSKENSPVLYNWLQNLIARRASQLLEACRSASSPTRSLSYLSADSSKFNMENIAASNPSPR
ncbi:hypothetical protein M3J09_002583 [Ascochyta lentis]